MPNWTRTNVKVTGENVEEFMKTVFNKDFCFKKYVPEPATREECEERYILNSKEDADKHYLAWNESDERRWFNWYDWHCDKWSTKWDILSEDTTTDEDSITFYTAWSCPLNFLETFSKLFPNYTFEIKFDNEGDWGGGKYKLKNGVETEIEITEIE